jgi:integral membrane protein (TIGR00529 family)
MPRFPDSEQNYEKCYNFATAKGAYANLANMTLLEHIPAIIKMIMIFLLVLICIRKKLSLGNAFLLGTLFLSFLFGLKPRATLTSIFASITDPKTLSIAAVVSLILVLSSSMELAGQMQRMLKNFQGLVSSPRLNLVIFPALIGLLPMPGGAVFSAPMVKELGMRSKLSEAQLSFVNYWFRHIWEYWWPLYPGILLTTVITEISLVAIIGVMCPFTAVALWLGYRALKGPGSLTASHNKNPRPRLWPFIKELVPILVVIFPGLGMGVLFSKLFPAFSISKEIGLILALCMAIAWVWYQNKTPKKKIFATLTNPQLLNMMYMIVGILIFKGILTDSQAAAAISQELANMHIPLVLIVMLLPLLVGVSGGIVIAYVGSTLPILVPMIQSMGEAPFLPAYVMLILVSGFMGVMLSPMHLCFLLTNQYFGVSLGSVYRYLWLPCVSLVAAGLIYFWILHALWGWM